MESEDGRREPGPTGAGEAVVSAAEGGLVLPGDVAAVGRYLTAAKAESTRRAYDADFRAWSAWARERGFTPLPAADAAVATYLAALGDAGASPRTIARRLSGIGHAHREAGYPSPSEHPGTREVLRGIRRTAARDGRRPRKARALDTQTIRALVEDLPPGPAGLRDRAVILTSFALGLRASDVCGLDVGDLTPAGHGGLDVTIRWSKTDQEGAGEVLALAPGVRARTCPVRALQAWVEAADLGGSGPLFRSVGRGAQPRIGRTRMARSSVRLVLRRAAERAGVPLEGLSPHSLRRSFATEGYRAGVSERELARTGRWASVTTMRGYDSSSRWADPASARLGL
ncbi:Site-specific recombinase XerD [Geodermatophilus telluris]|uniref:Site-specific recombinase XerD n=1 Tax=Geodermatophilus telluris TaxID=1190417 RepID=A0A1G6TLE2_9ACTN|nr:site-specific integrase [Geodermatophilus telluris]SDD29893.1 Site-specific recombinase XerD [Geodermatophilus telluris]